jgi:hypothetical protein
MIDRQLLAMTVVLSLVASAIALATSGGDWVTVAISLPLFMTASFWSLKLSRWFTHRVMPQPEAPVEPTPTEATTARPEHAQRRRRQRRTRSRR